MVVSLLLHVTPSVNIRSIQERGLTPIIGERSADAGETTPAIYCFDDGDAIENALLNWLSEVFDEDETLALFMIRLPKILPIRPAHHYEIVLKEEVPPAQLTLLSPDIDDIKNIIQLLKDNGFYNNKDALEQSP
jgi:hypothetical protein